MSFWRFLGELPSARSREELAALSIEGWNPWHASWLKLMESDIVVPDPKDSRLWHHVHVYQSGDVEGPKKFAATPIDGMWHFWVPATESEQDAFAAPDPMYEGHWRTFREQESELPWPEPEPGWSGRASFLSAFDRVEAQAARISYRGCSYCRLCGCTNGHEALRVRDWEWPAGYRHYVVDHDLRPSAEFESFILAAADSQLRSR